MPGIFGAVGCPDDAYDDLHAEYLDAWGPESCEVLTSGRARLGGHAFGAERALYSLPARDVAIDGDVHAYDFARGRLEDQRDPLLREVDGFLELHPEVACNAAAVHRESGRLSLVRDWAGSFPMYYVRWRDGLLFANLLRPLARLVGADLDRIGVLQYLRRGYIYGDRTPFRSISRLRPGESLRFDPDTGTLATSDRSRLWVGESVEDEEQAARLCLDHLERSVEADLRAARDPALMMSGGWDSRTLLAVSEELDTGRRGSSELLGYSHGDTGSRELSLVRRLCREYGVSCRLEPIDDAVFDVDSLHQDFGRTGIAVFPHWQRSGRVLAANDRGTAMAGIFGEVVGGHYGRTMTAGGIGKVRAFLSEAQSRPDRTAGRDPVEGALEQLRVELTGSDHWYLDTGFERSIDDKQARINADLRDSLHRLRARGIEREERLIEACVTEHRGSQYIAGQTASCRAGVDVSLPFADRSLLRAASRVPAHTKLHNSLNRRMLELLDTPARDVPLAATLIPASAHLYLQEASRAVRKVWQGGRWWLHDVSRGALPAPRLSWVDFEFLRESENFRAAVDDLQADCWDHRAIRARVEDIRRVRPTERLHPLFDQFGKIYTIDRLLA